MKLLNIFDFGWGGILVLTVVFLGGATAMFLCANKVSKSGGQTQGTVGTGKGTTYDGKKTPIYNVSFFWYGVILVVAYLCILAFIKSDYRKQKAKDGVPQEQTDTTRQAAEEMIKK